MAENMLRVRARQKSKKPDFNRHDCHKKKRLSISWRKPRGIHNKMRDQVAAKGGIVKAGYGSPRAVRGFHPSGYKELFVKSIGDLEGAEGCVLRIAAAIGGRKRAIIIAKAAEMNLRVLNPRVEKPVPEAEAAPEGEQQEGGE